MNKFYYYLIGWILLVVLVIVFYLKWNSNKNQNVGYSWVGNVYVNTWNNLIIQTPSN